MRKLQGDCLLAMDTGAKTSTNLSKNKFLGMPKYILSNQEMETLEPDALLRHMLSTQTAISTSASLAEAIQRACDDSEQKAFTTIGEGECGTVYALRDTATVLKLPNSPQMSDQLFSEFQIHTRVKDAFSLLPWTMVSSHNINVPDAKMWVSPNSDHFWSDRAFMIPSTDVAVPNYGLVSERIFPLPLPVRSALVDEFCPKDIQDHKAEFLAKHENKDCLVRLYLGRHSKDTPITSENTRLRNFPLHIDQMRSLQLDVDMYAKTMAHALAVLHWEVGVDGDGVEFVLGASPQTSPTLPESFFRAKSTNKDNLAKCYVSDLDRRTVSMWLLDFDLCKKREDGLAGLRQLMDTFWRNNSSYPRHEDERLWSYFWNHYNRACKELAIGQLTLDLAEVLVSEMLHSKKLPGGGFAVRL